MSGKRGTQGPQRRSIKRKAACFAANSIGTKQSSHCFQERVRSEAQCGAAGGFAALREINLALSAAPVSSGTGRPLTFKGF